MWNGMNWMKNLSKYINGQPTVRVDAFGKNYDFNYDFNLIGMCLWGGEGVGKRDGVKPTVFLPGPD